MATSGIITTRIERIVNGGEGLSRIGERKLFVAYSAPGDLVRVKINEEHDSWARGEILEIEEASPLRAQAICPLYGRCGGCSLQHISYEAQLSAKEGIVRDCFSRIGSFENMSFNVKASSPFGYRNRLQFHCLPNDRSCLGFKAAHGTEIIPVSGGEARQNRKSAETVCPVAEIGIQNALKENRIKPPPEKDRFTVYGKDGLLLSEGGQSRGKISLSGKELTIDAGVFFQSNAAMLEILLEDLKDAASGANHELGMADIYCGIGTFAAFLNEGFPFVELVEKNKTALALARENVLCGERRFFALSGDEWAKRQTGKEKRGFAIVDPPREGLSPALRTYLAKHGPEILAYVSCDPATLARDAKELSSGIYELKELKVYDFYPQTSHIESLAIFRQV